MSDEFLQRMISRGAHGKLAGMLAIWLMFLAVANPVVALSYHSHAGHGDGFGMYAVEQEKSLGDCVAAHILSHCNDSAGHCDFCSLQPKLSAVSLDLSEIRAVHRDMVGWVSERMFGIYRPPKS
jgi:hypothetical protein